MLWWKGCKIIDNFYFIMSTKGIFFFLPKDLSYFTYKILVGVFYFYLIVIDLYLIWDQTIIWGKNKSCVSAPKWCSSNSLSSITRVTSSLIKGLLTNLGCQGDRGELQGLRWLQPFDLGLERGCKSLQLSTVCRAKNFFCISLRPASALSSKNVKGQGAN